MNIFSFILTILSTIYIFLGFKVIQLDKRSLLNRLFFALNLGLIIWSVASAFYISAYDEAACIFWYKLSSVGFYLLIGILLHFFLVFAKKEKLLKHRWIYIIIYLPSVILSFLEITVGFYAESYFLGSNGWIIAARTDSVWYWASIAYIIVYMSANIFISYRFRKAAISLRERKQTRALIVTAVVSLLTGLGIMVLVSILDFGIPDLTPISGAIWSIGIFYAIAKYKLLAMTPSFIAESLFQTIIDSVIIANPKGLILSVNPETQRLLGYNQKELVGEPLGRLFLSDKSKNTNISELLNRCPVRNMETFMIPKIGVKIPIILSISECKDNYDTRIGFVLASKDITEYKIAEEKIQHLATHDSLTGLPNRLMLSQLLNHSIQIAKRHKRKLAVFFIDLDRFKIINDTKGHNAGDQLLQEIAMRYKQTLRAEDVVSRQGGDEFVIMIEDFQKLSDLELLANSILASTYKPVVLLGDECRVTASIGISLYPQDGEDEQLLMKHADMAMYFAKEEGKNNFQFYSKDIQSLSAGRLAMETNLRLALERNELSLHYQAKVNFKTGIITGVEALLRWQNPHLGAVTPTQFIPVAEETGIIVPIGRWVLKTACAQNVAWQKQGLPPVSMAVNVSLRQLTDNNLLDDIKAALNDSGMAPNLLELEITESMIMSNLTKMMDVLVRIKSLGVRLAVDDFGTGYSSLAQLKKFPIDTLKIDRSFIRNVPENAEDKAITHAIIAMGVTLGLTVVAEGVETIEQMNYLKDQSCDEMQGFYFSRPVVPEQFADLLREQADTFHALKLLR
jgi:diguanylate cyclase (GGDEF)-like protein/PAS domain S-box-containing protein